MKAICCLSILLLLLVGQLTRAADPDVTGLIKSLNNSRKGRLAAMQQLGKLGNAAKAAVPVLGSYLGLKDESQAEQAAKALAQIGEASIPELVKALKDSKPEVQKRALRAIAVIGPEAKAAVPSVSAFLTHADAKFRSLAAQVLGAVGPAARPAVPALGKALQDSDVNLRAFAAAALHEIGNDTVRELLPLVSDKRMPVRLSAVGSLAMFHESTNALDALVGALHDREVAIRRTAAAGLIRVGPAGRSALPALLACLKEKDRDLQKDAFVAVMSIGSFRDKDLLAGLMTVNDTAGWAPQVGSKKLVATRTKKLRMDLQDPNPTQRLGAVLALAQLGPNAKAAIPDLMTISEEPGEAIRAAVALARHAIDLRKDKDTGKAAKLISQLTERIRSAQDPETEEIVQLYLLAATACRLESLHKSKDRELISLLRQARDFAATKLDKLPYTLWTLPALTRGINLAARLELGFTEPFCRLAFRFQALIPESKDLKELTYAFTHLREGISNNSPYGPSIDRSLYQVLINTTFLNSVLQAKGQRMQGLIQGLVTGAHQQATLNDINQIFARFIPICHGYDFDPKRSSHLKSVQLELEHHLTREHRDLETFVHTVMLLKARDLYRSLYTESSSSILEKLRDADPLTRWTTVYLVNQRRIHAEKELVALLRDPSVDVRIITRQTLIRLARGTDFGPHPLDAPAKIDRAIERWQNWLALQGGSGTSGSSAVSRPSPGELSQSIPRHKKE